MDYQIKNKKILLVGCAGVLGSEFTDHLYKNGGILILVDLNSKKFESFKNITQKQFLLSAMLRKNKIL